MITIGIFTLVISGIVAWAVTPAVIWIARRIDAVDLPGPRKVHHTPVPRIGGVAVLIGMMAGLLAAGIFTRYLFALPQTTINWTVVGVAALAMFLMGLVDDLRGLSFKSKFAVQILAATSVWVGGFRIEILSYPFGSEPLELGVFSLPLTVLWIVGITNAINLIDGLDGLAAGVALIVTATVAAIAVQMDYKSVAAMSTALVGSLAGFLVYNFNPARIFLGDSGSMFVGFMLAVMSMRGNQKGATAVAVLVPLLILGIPIVDTSFAILRRGIRIGYHGRAEERRLSYVLRNVHRVFLPDREHVHHRLLEVGLSQRAAVLILYCVGVVLALAALAIVMWNSLPLAMVLVGVLCVLAAGFVGFVMGRSQRRGTEETGGGAEENRTSVKIGGLTEAKR